MKFETIHFEKDRVIILDQNKLPGQKEYVPLFNLMDVMESIRTLRIRGAPAIGILASYGLCLYARELLLKEQLSEERFLEGAAALSESRPTAVNLSWAVQAMRNLFQSQWNSVSNDELLSNLEKKAIEIHYNDKKACKAIGRLGSSLIDDGDRILTHCNAGALATGGIGTALGVIYSAAEAGKKIHVYVDETRPVGQGARLTMWELIENSIDATLITDNMAGALMQNEKIDKIIVGADRITANGDVANKIGTYSLAVLARYHKIPFYVAAPLSSFDTDMLSGHLIPIEERPANEITAMWYIEPFRGYQVYNPAFDVTPAELVSAIITEKGIINNISATNIKQLF